MYTDGSVTENTSTLGCKVQQNQQAIFKDSTAYRTKPALYWLAERTDGGKSHAVILTDSVSLLQKVKMEPSILKGYTPGSRSVSMQ